MKGPRPDGGARTFSGSGFESDLRSSPFGGLSVSDRKGSTNVAEISHCAAPHVLEREREWHDQQKQQRVKPGLRHSVEHQSAMAYKVRSGSESAIVS
jgi:hypothetical protein